MSTEHSLPISKPRSINDSGRVTMPGPNCAGSTGRKEFLKKRSEVIASSTHWVEIDLLGLR